MRRFHCPILGLAALLVAATAGAQAGVAQPATPAPYSLPWLLRSAVASSAVRLDRTEAFYVDPATGASGRSHLTGLAVTYKASPRWVPVFRVIYAESSAPRGGRDASGDAFSNPLLGVNYVHPLGTDWRWTGFVASTIPIGSGGGKSPQAGAAAAIAAAIPARSAMDNALFSVNYHALIGGLGVARVRPQLTLQGEATVFQLTRVRGPESQDRRRTNFTAGIHAGHFFSPRVSLGAELRMQRWLSNALPVRRDPAARQQLTLAVGPRFHFKLSGKRWLRPGVSYTRALDDPMHERSYDIVQLDMPFAF
jgi:hypothetical protein